jgi:predicted PurR-regulated permease PerM
VNSRERVATAAYLLAALSLWLILKLQLLPAVCAGLLSYVLINAVAQSLQRRLPGIRAHRFVVVLLAVVVVSVLTLVIAAVVPPLSHEIGNPTLLFERITPLVERARAQLPASLAESFPDNAEELRDALIDWSKVHASQLQIAGRQAARLVGQLLIGVVLGAILALYTSRERTAGGPLTVAINGRCANFAIAFRDVVFAQTKISAINTLLTGIFLCIALPIFGVHLPLTKTLLIATFVLGMLPVIGNLISNTLIVVVALSISLWVAVAVLVFLIGIHKLEYFLNARIVGTRIQAQAWELLIAMLLMETLFGIAGLVAAPIYYAYLKRELTAAGLI